MKKILQAFKKIFRRKAHIPKSGQVYVCDPNRHDKCSKGACWYIVKGPCRCTTKKKYAKLDEKGKPVIATDDEVCNLEWMERQISIQRQLTDAIER